METNNKQQDRICCHRSIVVFDIFKNRIKEENASNAQAYIALIVCPVRVNQ